MQTDAAAPATRKARSRGLPLRALVALVHNPLDALPAALFDEPMVRVRAGGLDRFYLADPELIQKALVGHAHLLIKGRETRRTLGPALGEGLLTAEEEHWRWQRRSVAAAFQPARLQALLPAMIACAETTRDRWLAHAGAPLMVGHEMMRTTFDIIVETMLSGAQGMDVGMVERSVTAYLEPTGWVLLLGLLGAPEWAPYPGRRRSRRAAAAIRAALAERVAERRARPAGRQDLLAMLLAASDPQTGRAMTDEEVTDNLVTFITAGHETTALGLAWTFHLLARRPDVEARALAQIDAVTAGGPVRPEHVERLDYVRRVFSEAMRLYPPAPIISRQAKAAFQIAGVPVAPGSMVVVPIYAVHRHRRTWPDPEAFDPDRFGPDASQGRSRYAYMPFGAGPRVCIGSGFAMMEAVAVLAVLLQRVRLRDAARRPSRPVMRVTLRPSPDLRMTVERRPATA